MLLFNIAYQYLNKKIEKAAKETNICNVAIAGGVSANSELRKQLKLKEDSHIGRHTYQIFHIVPTMQPW